MKKKKFKIIKLRPEQDYSYKRKILINDLTLLMSIGIHDFEKIKKQEVKFNINIDINPLLAPNKGKLNSIVNYETVVKDVTRLTKNKHYELLETLAEDIFFILFKNNNKGYPFHLVKISKKKSRLLTVDFIVLKMNLS